MRGSCRRRVGTLFALLLALMLSHANASANGSISGAITLEGIDPAAPAQQVNFEFSPDLPTNATVFVKTAMIPPSGIYTLTDIPAGTYSVGIKGSKWLRATVAVTVADNTLTPQVVATLNACDADNDNTVGPSDFAIFISAYDTAANVPGSGYDIRADFTCDGFVDTTDFNLFVSNYNIGGAPYRIVLDPPASASPRQVLLTWRLVAADGHTTLPTPNGMTFNIYRSGAIAHTAGGYITVTEGQGTTGTHTTNTYTDTVSNAGAYYYQIVATAIDNFDPTHGNVYYALSNLQEFVPNPPTNPLVEVNYPAVGSYTITGFQPDNATINYQATIKSGLLNSLLVFNNDNAQGREFFHQDTATGFLPLQFGDSSRYPLFNVGVPALPYRPVPDHTGIATATLGNGVAVPGIVDAGPTLTFPFKETYNIADATLVAYQATTTGLYMTLTPNYLISFAYAIGCQPNVSPTDHVIAAQSKAEAPKAFYRLSGSGVTHGLPLPSSFGAVGDRGPHDTEDIAGVPNLRYYLDNGAALDVQDIAAQGLYLRDFGHLFGHYSNAGVGTVPDHATRWGFAGNGPIQLSFNKADLTNAPVAVKPQPPPPFRLRAITSGSASGWEGGNNADYQFDFKGGGLGMYALNGPADSNGLNS